MMLRSNPELMRNVWLNMSLHRLIGTPIVIGLIILVMVSVNLGGHKEVMGTIAAITQVMFYAVAIVYGGYRAQASVSQEMLERTWDQQRMSALHPWAMTWGKLLGSNVYTWYAAAICLVIYCVTMLPQGVGKTLVQLGIMLLAAILVHGLSALLALVNMRTRSVARSQGSSLATGFLLLALFIAFTRFVASSLESSKQDHFIKWYDLLLAQDTFILFSVLFLAVLAVFGAYRLMCNELAVRTLPWAWVLGLLLLALYLAGFNDDIQMMSLRGTQIPFVLLVLSVLVLLAVVSAYMLMSKEFYDNSVVRNVVSPFQQGKPQRSLEMLPLAPVSIILALVAAFVACVLYAASAITFGPDQSLPIALLCVSLLALRDFGLLLFFSLGSKPQSAMTTAMIYWVVLQIIVPLLLSAVNLKAVSLALAPFELFGNWTGLLVMLVQSAVVWYLVARRWHAHRQLV